MFLTPRGLADVLRRCGFQRCRRLRWHIRYSDRPLRRGVHHLLQSLYLDGELRYLAYKS